MVCAFETTCLEVTPIIDRTARNTAELADITFKVAKERIYQRLLFVLQKWNAHSIAMNLRPQEKAATRKILLSLIKSKQPANLRVFFFSVEGGLKTFPQISVGSSLKK
jgi:hypothetical protein